jgi:signal transduction histidine kinase
MMHDITERKIREDCFRKEFNRSNSLLHLAARLNAHLDFTTVMDTVCEATASALNVPSVTLSLYDDVKEAFILSSTFGLPPGFRERHLPIPRSFYDEYAAKNFPLIIIPDLHGISDVPNADLYAHHNICTIIFCGMIREDKPIGMIGLHTLGEPRTFDDDELTLIKGLSDQATMAIVNARLFDQVHKGRERMRTLSQHLIQALEAERRRIARVLHDEIGQTLTGLKLSMEMNTRLPAEEVKVNLHEMQVAVSELIVQIRDLSHEFRPSILDDLGLLAALLWHFGRYTMQTNVQVHFKHSVEITKHLPPEIESTAYRIVQEALTNVARHAGVNEVTVRLWTGAEKLNVQIEDQGAGFDFASVLSAGVASGLVSIRERAMLAGGQLVIESGIGAGTLLTVELPLSNQDAGGGRKGRA